MANILVTGAAGFIGSHTVGRLLEAGHRVAGADNFRTGKRENVQGLVGNGGFSLWERDVSVAGQLDSLVERTAPEAIIHLAGLVSVRNSIDDPELNFCANVRATHLVAESARRHRVGRVVFASSAAVYGNSGDLPLHEALPGRPISPYGAAKLASESLLLGHAATYGFTGICLRYFNVYGSRQDPSSPYSGVISIALRDFAEGRRFTLFGDGRQTRDFIHVADVARANVLAATLPGLKSGIMNVCTGREAGLLDVVTAIAAALKRPPEWLQAPARAGDIRRSVGDPAAAKAGMGFAATTEMATGLAETIHCVAAPP
jgi:UDP-glucose 4-epimerase